MSDAYEQLIDLATGAPGDARARAREVLCKRLVERDRAMAVVDALVEFEAVHAEIDAEREDLEPMSPRAVKLGGKSINAWRAIQAALGQVGA